MKIIAVKVFQLKQLKSTGIAEVMGSTPVQAWIFSGFFFSTA